MDPALTQRLVTFNTYFFGFLLLDRLSFFGNPPSGMETWLMALVLGLAVTFLSPHVATLLDRGSASDSPRPPRERALRDRPKRDRPKRDRPGQRSSGFPEDDYIAPDPVAIDLEL